MDVFNLFHHKVLGGSDSDIVHGKPAPDIFLAAARRFPDNPDPSKVRDVLRVCLTVLVSYFRLIKRCTFSVWRSRMLRMA